MNIEKLREEIEYDEGECQMKYIWIILVYLLLVSAILLEKKIPNMDGKSEHLSMTTDALSLQHRYRNSPVRLLKLYPDFDDLPEEPQRIIANMMFNLGYVQGCQNLKV